MATKLLISSSEEANMRYATGLSVPDPFIWFATSQNEYIVANGLEYGRIKKECKKGTKVLLLDDIKLDNIKKPINRKRTLADVAAAVLLSLNLSDIIIPVNMWAGDLEVLREHGFRPRIERPFFPEREVKTSKEIEMIKAVGLTTKKAMEHAIKMIEESEIQWDDKLTYKGETLTSEKVKFEIEKVFMQDQCMSGESIVSCADQSALPHHRGSGPLLAGKPIIIDLFPKSLENGYYFDMTRTVCKGTPSKDLQKQYETVKRAQEEAINIVAPGKVSHVDEAVQEIFKESGYETTEQEGFIHSTGHGLGLEIHESPGISSKSEYELKKGNVITIEPGLYYEDTGGVRIEDTILVTDDGHENLTNFPKELTLK